jgi:hypothetical protein
MSKNIVEIEGPRTHNMAHTPTRSGTHMHARTRKHAHTDQYVILIAFPQQQWCRERATMLRYKYIACLVTNMYVLFSTQSRCHDAGTRHYFHQKTPGT